MGLKEAFSYERPEDIMVEKSLVGASKSDGLIERAIP